MTCHIKQATVFVLVIALVLFALSCEKNPVDADRVHLTTEEGWPAITIDGYHRYREPNGFKTYDYRWNFLNQPVAWKKDHEKDDVSRIVTAYFHDVGWKRYDDYSQEVRSYKVDVFGKTFSWP